MTERLAERLENIGLQDNSATREHRIYGPPGTGKTTQLARQVERAVDRFGPSSVLGTSFSKAAAAELGKRVDLEPGYISTMHSHCYRALERPKIAEANVEGWNKRYPGVALTPVRRNEKLDGESHDEELDVPLLLGDRLLQGLNRHRGLMLSEEYWPPEVREFSAKWCDYKSANSLCDFCDLIEESLYSFRSAPSKPSVIIADEAQDLTPMMAALVRKWGSRADYFIMAGDDDQLVYGFVGATPEVLLEPQIPDDHKVFLEQSHRVPRAVHAVAEQLIRRVTQRQVKRYEPRPAEGAVHRLSSANYRSPEYFILKTLESHLHEGKTIMFLGSCAYMLRPVTAVLRKNGIPFHNPYRKSNGFWNPLRTGSPGSAANRILRLLGAESGWGPKGPSWLSCEMSPWAEWLDHHLFVAEWTEIAEILRSSSEVDRELLAKVFVPNALTPLLTAIERGPDALLAWWCSRLRGGFRKRVRFPVDIVERRGLDKLRETPQVVVGTIHSVKGGQADVVYLFPDLSRAAEAQYQQCGPSRDSVLRVLYVGVTRARETLYICSPGSAIAVAI